MEVSNVDERSVFSTASHFSEGSPYWEKSRVRLVFEKRRKEREEEEQDCQLTRYG
jgi:hypothetical protein